MNYFDLLFSPKGTIKPQPFAIIVISVYLINIVAGSVIEGQFIRRAGPWPYFALQSMLTWIWFAAHAKRLRDAGRGYVVAAATACIYLLGAALLGTMLEDMAASTVEGEENKESVVSLLGTIIAVIFISTLFTGNYSLAGFFLFLIIGLPLLFTMFVVIYSIVTGMRASLTPVETPVSSEPPSLPPPPQPSRSPFA